MHVCMTRIHYGLDTDLKTTVPFTDPVTFTRSRSAAEASTAATAAEASAITEVVEASATASTATAVEATRVNLLL